MHSQLIVRIGEMLLFACRQQLSPEDLHRYTEQFQHIQEITQLYEQDPDNFPKLIDLLQQVSSMSVSMAFLHAPQFTLSGWPHPIPSQHSSSALSCASHAV